MSGDDLATLPNIGKKLAGMLRQAGVRQARDIQSIGAAKLYQKMQMRAPKRLPVCYYLYSLEAAARGIDWRQLSDADKKALRKQAGLQ